MNSNTKRSAAPWWRGAFLYQVYPRSFLDTNGDGLGDLPGITQKLDYIAALGVDGIWISPFFKSPMKDFGYDVSDYRDVDPIFGTLKDFDALLKRAHELDLKIIIDLVSATHRTSTHGSSKAVKTHPIRKRIGMSGATNPITGSPFSAARHGRSIKRAGNIICIIS
jgi:alpha-glucosidase